MHGASIVGYHQFAQADPLDHLRQRGLSCQIETSFSISTRDHFSSGSILRRPKNRESEIRVDLAKPGYQLCKIFCRPRFVCPTGPRLKENPARVAYRPLLPDV